MFIYGAKNMQKKSFNSKVSLNTVECGMHPECLKPTILQLRSCNFMLIPKRTQQNPQNLERTAHRPKLTPNGLESARNHHQPMFKIGQPA